MYLHKKNMNYSISFLLVVSLLFSCKSKIKKELTVTHSDTNTSEKVNQEKFIAQPVSHATMVITWDSTILYIDPVGGGEAFTNYPKPDLILVTDIHGDHLNLETLQAINTPNTKIIVPQAVADKLPSEINTQVIIINNGDLKDILGFSIEAIPMYNLREEALKFHEKGRGNGYVIENNGKRVYISGDTEDIPEMRALKNIDIAFVCMNLPYTMTPESAADAVIEFAPKMVYPYHYRGTEGMSDVAKFKSLVQSKNPNINVNQLDWYK